MEIHDIFNKHMDRNSKSLEIRAQTILEIAKVQASDKSEAQKQESLEDITIAATFKLAHVWIGDLKIN